MNALKAQFLFLFSFFAHHISANITACREVSCEPGGSVPIRFPFRLRGRQSPRCGHVDFAGRWFDLSCNNRSQTVIDLRRPGSTKSLIFVVQKIDYESQSLWITDPGNCLPKRLIAGDLAEFTTGEGPLRSADGFESFTFLRCPPEATPFRRSVPCLGDGATAVRTIYEPFLYRGLPEYNSPAPAPAPSPAEGRRRRRCEEIGVAWVPQMRPDPAWEGPTGLFFVDLNGPVRLTWQMPVCRECERRGGVCRPRVGSGSEIGCSVPLRGTTTGLPRSAKYGIIVGVGIPGVLCFIGLASYVCSRVKGIGHRRQPYSDRANLEAPQPTQVIMGFDGPTIESFPKIELGESKRLPKPNDNTCPICLSEYQSKETLRTIPECNHYFHANCVDEWLKMNATCPLCRNSPDGSSSSHVSTSTSGSSVSSSSLLSPS